MHLYHLTPRTGISFLAIVKIGLVALLLSILPALAFAAQVTLAWDPNNPAPSGYRLYQRAQGQSYDFNRPAWSGSGTTCTVANLNADTQYYFVVRAYTGNSESGNSNEVGLRTARANRAPVAQAGGNQTVTSGATVRLNGSGSFHPDGLALTYRWTQTAGRSANLSSTVTAQPRFTAPLVTAGGSTTLIFELTVSDPNGLTSSDTCLVQVVAPPSEAPPTEPTNPPDDATPPPTEADLLPPLQPSIYYPAASARDVSLTPRLTASAFSGAQSADTHQRSQWRIWRTRDQQLVMDATRTHSALDSLWVPFFTLWPGTTYACQVRYIDNHDQASEWSAPVTFTTRSSWFARTAFEMGAAISFSTPRNADANDWTEQADDGQMQTVLTEDGRFLMAVDSVGCAFVAEIEGAAAVAPYDIDPAPPLADDHPYGVLGYRLLMKGSDQTAEVTLQFAEPIDPQTRWIAYGADGEWVDCSHNVEVLPDGLTAIRTIDDGGPEDADGVANGVIVDLLAPVQASADPDTSGKQLDGGGAGSGGGSGGCFIGTLLP